MRKLLVVFFAALTSLPLASAELKPQKDAVAHYFELRERTLSSRGTTQDVDKLLALMTADAKVEHPGAAIVMSREEARQGMKAHLGEGGEATYRLRSTRFDGDHAVVEFTLTYASDGKKSSRAGVEIFEFRGRKISRVVVYTDAFMR